MRACTLIGAGVGASLLGSPAVATAQTTTTELFAHSGLNCVPKPGDAAKLAYDFREGIRNISTAASATVFCPVNSKPFKQGADYVPAGIRRPRVGHRPQQRREHQLHPQGDRRNNGSASSTPTR